jgi:3-isopropylmalate dehydrogenase
MKRKEQNERLGYLKKHRALKGKMKTKKIAVLAGDGIGPEIVAEAMKILSFLNTDMNLGLAFDHALLGGAAYDAFGTPLPQQTLNLCKNADAILLGAVGGPKWEGLPHAVRPERGLLGIRSELGLFANLRPAILYPQLVEASTLKPEVVSGLDLMIVRELTGGIYFGEPRGIATLENNEKRGINTKIYTESEIRRVAHSAFRIAQMRSNKLCSVDKANVLESTELWRNVVSEVGKEYPEVQLSHMYVDNAAMQLIRQPKQFDVMLATNMFGDILSDIAAMLTGSIGMLPSASLDANAKGLYEPIHGSAPDIAGQGIANPLATILSVAMMLRYTFNAAAAADRIQQAVNAALDAKVRTADIYSEGMNKVSTAGMGDAVLQALQVI